MTAPGQRSYLLCYDVACPRRLGRLYRFLLGQGMPIQYSVFLILATPGDIRKLIGQIVEIIDETLDDVRIYPLPHRPRLFRVGEDILPDEVRFFDQNGTSVW